jgi:hypothetical protein
MKLKNFQNLNKLNKTLENEIPPGGSYFLSVKEVKEKKQNSERSINVSVSSPTNVV